MQVVLAPHTEFAQRDNLGEQQRLSASLAHGCIFAAGPTAKIVPTPVLWPLHLVRGFFAARAVIYLRKGLADTRLANEIVGTTMSVPFMSFLQAKLFLQRCGELAPVPEKLLSREYHNSWSGLAD